MPSIGYSIVEYQYRDASNYKAQGRVLLEGEYSDEQFAFLTSVCDEGKFFIPEQVGLPPLREELYAYSGGPTEDDHQLHELLELRPAEPSECNQRVWGFLAELVDRFQNMDDDGLDFLAVEPD